MTTATFDSPWLLDVSATDGADKSFKQELSEFVELNKQEGALITASQAAMIIGVSKQRVAELVQDGRLNRWERIGAKYLSFNEVIRFSQETRQTGRPKKLAFLVAAADRSE